MKGLFNKTGLRRAFGSGLTKKELIIIAFLAVSFLAGLITKYSGWKDPGDFDYSEPDKKFEAQMKTAFDELNSSRLSNEQDERVSDLKHFADSLRVLSESSTQMPRNLPPGKKININTALTGDMQLLPGIGEITAERIIEYRERAGGFKAIEDIKKVKGIGEKKFEKLKEYITVE